MSEPTIRLVDMDEACQLIAILRSELAAAQAKINELHRRTQRAEAACAKLADDWLAVEKPRGGNFGRALLASAYARAKERIAELEKENEWHPASEKPEPLTRILSVNENGEYRIDYWWTQFNRYVSEADAYGNRYPNIVKWRNIPKPPKEGV